MSRVLAVSVIILITIAIIPTLAQVLGAASPPTPPETNTPSLNVSVSPPNLPADGGVYPAIYIALRTPKGGLLAAPADVSVRLTSAILEVGSVDPVAVILAGQTYAVASFHTTLTPGSTNITATAAGAMSSTGKVSTVSPSGSAVRLGVFASPPALLPQVGSTGKVIVQLLDAGGRTARASSATSVTLASSSPNVADVTQSITIQKDQTYGTAITTAAYTAGSTTITASASGLSSGFTHVTVEGQNPSKLFVRVAPGVLASNGEFGVLVVQLQSQDGTPTPAPQNIVITTTSSNTTVGVVPQNTLTIMAGRTFANGSFIALAKGTSIVSATAQSYGSGFFTVKVVKPGSTSKGGQLALIPALPVVLSDRESFPVLVAQLRNSSGVPSTSGGIVYVGFASSTPFVGSVQTSVVIPQGRTFSVASFVSTLAPGVTNITASASNFVSASTLLTSAGPVPFQLAVILGPQYLIANGSAYSTTAVQLQDSKGKPAKAPTDITVTLASSMSGVGDVSHTVTIPAGSSHSYASFTSSLNAGLTQITATAPGYVSGQGTITTIPPAESTLGIYADPQTLPADGGSHAALVVQLQDQNGLPVKATVPANVTLSASNPLAISVDQRVEIASGATFAVANVQAGTSNGTSIITAQASGLTSASTTMQVTLLPMRALLQVLSPAPVLTLVPSSIRLNVSSGPYPVPGASVTWSTDSNAKIEKPKSLTDGNGVAVLSVAFAGGGNTTISALVSKSGYGERLTSLKILVQSQQLSVIVIPDTIDLGVGGTTGISAIAASKGKPVSGVSISWSADSGSLDTPISTTDAQGAAHVNFVAASRGRANITATATLPGYATVTQKVQITVGNAVAQNSDILGSTLAYLPFIVVAIVVVLGVLLFMRRRRRRGKSKEAKKEKAEAAEPLQEEGEEAEGDEE